MANHLRAELVLDALEMALWNRRPARGLIHHSDHGCQYTSFAFGCCGASRNIWCATHVEVGLSVARAIT